jgi:small subunit ribosomal protein S4e
MHLKRQKSPKNWPIKRKGTKYVVRPNFNTEKGVPVLIFLRDMLKLARNRKEVKKALHEKQVLLNNKPIRDDKNSVLLFDIISVIPTGKHYKLLLSKFGKFDFEEISGEKINQKIAKVIGKKILKNKKIQINLSDGNNFDYSGNFKINDSAVFGFKERKISKIIPLKEKTKAIVYAGKHTGKEGIIEGINSGKKMAELNTGEEKINVLIKQIMVVE